jgi:type IV secretory pathway VirB10-like protein
MTPTENPTDSPAAPQPPVPDPSRPALPPITRVNSRILYAAAIFGLLVIWVVTFTVTTRHPQAKAPAPPQVQDAAPNLDSLASLAERVRVAEEMRKKLAPPKRPAPFDPFRSSLDDATPEDPTLAGSSQRRGTGSAFSAPQESRSLAPVRYMAEPARPPQPAPGPTRLEQALSAPPLITPSTHSVQAEASEPAAGDSTARLVNLLARQLPGNGASPGEPRRPAEPLTAEGAMTGSAPTEAGRSRTAAETQLVRPQSALSPYVLFEGTILPAVLTSEVTPDLPGIVTATLRSPVYDSPSGHHLLLPPGTRALGRYETNLANGDSRLLVSWHRLILPDGRFFEIPLSAGADIHGATGLIDRTDRHLGRVFTSTLLLSILSAGAQLSQPASYSDNYHPPSAGEVAAGAVGQQVSHLSSDLLGRDLQVKPTVTIRPGTAFGIVLQADIVFSAPYAQEAGPEATTP